MNITPVLQKFSELIKTRLETNVHTTEDSVRFTFFAALLNEGIKPEEVILENPHPHHKLARARIDTWIATTDDCDGLAVEFKYDRTLPGGTNLPRPQRAGNLLHDFHRLSLVENKMRRLCIYLTDVEMVTYLRKPKNGLADFFNQVAPDLSFDLGLEDLNNLSRTSRTAAGFERPVRVKTLHHACFGCESELRVWEVIDWN